MKKINYGLILCLLVAFSPMTTQAQEAITTDLLGVTNAPGASIFNAYYNHASPWTMRIPPGLVVRDTTELYWDDGSPEAYFIVSSPPLANDRFGVKFKTPGPFPMKIVAGRFYTNVSGLPMQSFSVCPDAGGYPDVFHPIDQLDTIAGGNPGWGSYPLHGAIFDSTIWAVVRWIPGYMVGIGADSTAPDGNSYWCSHVQAQNWHQWTATDWLMRLSVAAVTDSHDVTAVAILEPPGRFIPGDTTYPTAVFGNCGLAAETFNVTFNITDSIGNTVYNSTEALNLLSGQAETLTFVPNWVELDEGMYNYIAYTSLAGDADPTNDTVRIQGLCSREIIITYCGDNTNMGEAIIGTWATNRKFLVRMTPPVQPPFYLRRVQVFLCNGNAPLDYVCVCPNDGAGMPDTSTIYASATNISTPQDRTWATAYYSDYEVTQPGDLWVIAKWPEGITEPHIGCEIDDPSTERSWRYYFRNGAGHYENMGLSPFFREWYFRLIIQVPPLTGIDEQFAENQNGIMVECSPNPGKNHIGILFQTPQPANARLKIFNVAGRLIKSFETVSKCGSNRISWNGTDESGQPVSAGVYFLKFEAGGCRTTRKLILM